MRLTQVCSRISEGSSNVQTEGKATDSKQKNVTFSIKRDLFDDGIIGGAMTPWDKAAKPLQQRILKEVKPVGLNYLHYWWRYLPRAGVLQKISIKNFTCFEDRNMEKRYFVLVKNIRIFWYKGVFLPPPEDPVSSTRKRRRRLCLSRRCASVVPTQLHPRWMESHPTLLPT